MKLFQTFQPKINPWFPDNLLSACKLSLLHGSSKKKKNHLNDLKPQHSFINQIILH